VTAEEGFCNIYLLRHEGSTGKHKHTNIQNIQKHVKPYAIKLMACCN